jgi:hypothetical protein
VRSRLVPVLFAALGLSTDPAAAALLVYEPFDYSQGLTLADAAGTNGLNLTGLWSAPVGPFQQLATAGPGLDYGGLAGLPAPAGIGLGKTNGVIAGSATIAVDADVLIAPDTALYWSALMTLDDSANGNRFASITFTDGTTGDVIAFGEAVVGSGAIRVSAATAATGGLVANGPDNAFIDGHTLLLVGRYLSSSAPDGDRLDLLVYDTIDAEAIAPTFDLADPAAELVISLTGLDVDLARIDAITFAIRGQNDNFVDELRIGTSYGDVVPEPGTALLLAAGLCGLASMGSRRAKRGV